jgi:MFS family permease
MGMILASLIFFAVTAMGDEFFAEYGWRIPFLLSAVLLLIGVYMRRNITETSVFTETKKNHRAKNNPLKILITTHYKTLLLSALTISLAPTWVYTIMILGTGYMVQSNLMSRPDLAETQFYAYCVLGLVYVFAGWLGDRFNRYQMFVVAAVFSLFLTWPALTLLQQGQALYAMLLLSLLSYTMSIAPLMFADLYPAEIRTTGAGVSYNLGLVFSGIIIIINQHILTTRTMTDLVYVFVLLTVVALMAALYLAKRNRFDTNSN